MSQVTKNTPKDKNLDLKRQLTPEKVTAQNPSSGTPGAHLKPEPKVKKREKKSTEESPYKSPRRERVLSKHAVEDLQEKRQNLMTQKPDPAGWKKWCAINKPPKHVIICATTMLKYFPSEVHTIDAQQAIRFMQGMSEDRIQPLTENEAYQVLDAMVAKGTRFQSYESMCCARQIFDIVIEEGREKSLDRLHARLTKFVSAESATIALFSDAQHADAFLTTLLRVVAKFDTRIHKSDSADVRRTKEAQIDREIEQLQFVLSGLGRRATLTEPTLRGRKTVEEKQAKRRLTRSMETDSPTATAWANLAPKKEKRKSMQFVGPQSGYQDSERSKVHIPLETPSNSPSKVPAISLSSTDNVQSFFSNSSPAVTDSNVKLKTSLANAVSGTPPPPSPRTQLVASPKSQKLDVPSSGSSERASGDKSSSPAKVKSSAHKRTNSQFSTAPASVRQQGENLKDLTPQAKLLALLNDPNEASFFVDAFGQTAIGALRQVVVQQDDGKSPNYEVKIRKAKLETHQKKALKDAYATLLADTGFELGGKVYKDLLDAVRAIGQDLMRMEKRN